MPNLCLPRHAEFISASSSFSPLSLQADKQVEEIYLEFDRRRKEFDRQEADRQDEEELKLLEEVEKKIKNR